MRQTGLRLDLLFDFPLPAVVVGRRASRVRVRARAWCVASENDLLRLKRITRESRSAPGDAEDIAFLEARLAKRRR